MPAGQRANIREVLRQMELLTGTGTIFFVDSVTGASGNDGKSPDRPLATIAQALAYVTASKGDVIICMPGHVEAVNAAAYLTLNKAGMSLVGIGVGRNRPKLTWGTGTDAQVIISAANVTVKNMVLDFTGIDAVVAAVSVTGADVAFEDCECVVNTGTAGTVLGIVTAATATRFRVERCRFIGPATNTGTTVTACIKHEVGVDYVIKDNYFTGKMTQAILNATSVLGGLIDNNRFVIYTGTKAISMHAASTPFISNNRINVPSGTAPIVMTAGFVAGNVYSAASSVSAGTASTF